jgi:F-type H+-transporting ATPase subunit a
MSGVDIHGPQVYFKIPVSLPGYADGLPITETMVNYWIVMIFILLLCLYFSHGLKKMAKGKQVIAEKLITMLDNLVIQNMGQECIGFAPYIATLLMSSLFGSLCSLFCLRSVTADLNTTMGWALITFFLITYYKLKTNGVLGYMKSFTEPIVVMVPLNILSEIATPISMSFRHFGNMAGGLVISTLILYALQVLSNFVLGFLPVPLLQIGIPGVLSLYFDLFTGCMQAFIFSMLTMAYVSSAMDG